VDVDTDAVRGDARLGCDLLQVFVAESDVMSESVVRYAPSAGSVEQPGRRDVEDLTGRFDIDQGWKVRPFPTAR
jgi:hypothetical protein